MCCIAGTFNRCSTLFEVSFIGEKYEIYFFFSFFSVRLLIGSIFFILFFFSF